MGTRQNIVAVLPAPCLEWIQRIVEGHGVQCLLNKADCNDPKAFEHRVARLLEHPNVVGAFIIEMGCGSFHLEDTGHLPVSRMQLSDIEVGDFENLFVEKLNAMKNKVSQVKTNEDAGNVLIGLKCGGSTKESQTFMNSFVGQCVDKMIDQGFRFVFNEPQESQGQETLYKARTDPKSFQKWERFINTLNIGKKYMNKGNEEGGISTIYEKSAGALRKVGLAHDFEVVETNETSEAQLYQVLGTNQEPESFTQMTLQGAKAHIYLTGFGGIFGTAIAPSLSISMSKHNQLAFDYHYKPNSSAEEAFIDKVIAFLEGTPSRSELMKINLI